MLEKDLRKTYYEYFESFELIKNKIIQYLYSEELFFYKHDKETIKDEFNQYVKNISKLTNKLNKEKIQKEEYHKMLNQSIYEIDKKQKEITSLFENLLENELEKFYNCKNNVKKILKIHKQIIITINMYTSFTSYFYDYSTKDLKNLEFNELKKGDIVLSLKSKKIIKSNLFYKLISKITKSRIGHSTIFLGLNNKNKPTYIDVQDGDATVENLITNSKSIKYTKTSNKYSNDVIGLILRVKGGLSKQEEKLISEFTNAKTNLQYGFIKAILALIIGKIYEFLPSKRLKLKHPDQNLKTMFCSEFVIRTYENAQIYLQNKSDAAMTSPADLLNSPQLEIVGYINK